jgi:hypothetical protein
MVNRRCQMSRHYEDYVHEASRLYADWCTRHGYLAESTNYQLSACDVGEDGIPVVTLRNVRGLVKKVRLTAPIRKTRKEVT